MDLEIHPTNALAGQFSLRLFRLPTLYGIGFIMSTDCDENLKEILPSQTLLLLCSQKSLFCQCHETDQCPTRLNGMLGDPGVPVTLLIQLNLDDMPFLDRLPDAWALQ